MTIQESRVAYALFMGDSCGVEQAPELNAINQSIDECRSMLDYAIDRADKNEISFWRKMLQTAKVQRRELLAT